MHRPNGSTALNAYVKVALIRKNDYKNRIEEEEPAHFQRTAVHRHSSRPVFDHCFKFDLRAEEIAQQMTLSDAQNNNHNNNIDNVPEYLAALNVEDRLQLAVWHRDRQLK